MAKGRVLTFFEGKQLSKEFERLLLDQSLYLRYASLVEYLKDESLIYDPKEAHRALVYLEKHLYEQIFYFAHLQYHLMVLSDDWGSVGEQQVKLSFFRVLMKTAADAPITDELVDQFFNVVSENLIKLGIQDMSLATAKSLFESQRIKLLGIDFKANPGPKITQILRFLGSKYVLVSSPHLKGFAYILGKAQVKSNLDYRAFYISQEVMRSPSYILANVAAVCEHDVMLRYTAFETVFYQKWVQAFEPRVVYQFGAHAEDFSRISLAIKEKALSLYNADSVEVLEKSKKLFIEEMHETVLYHELGHGITKDYIFPYELVAIAQGIDYYHHMSAYEGLIEFLSDFAPPTHGLIGPMWNMVQVAKTDRVKAERLFYMYFSDVFFYDTQDAHMYDYSDMMCMIMVRYVNPDLSINFDQLELDMHYDPEKVSNTSLFQKLAKLFEEDMTHIRDKVMTFKYKLSEERDFYYVKSVWLEETRKFFKNATDKDPPFLSSFWTNVFSYIDHFSKDAAPEMKQFLEKKCKTVMAKVMVLAAGRRVAEQYQFDIRAYLVDRFKKSGLVSKR